MFREKLFHGIGNCMKYASTHFRFGRCSFIIKQRACRNTLCKEAAFEMNPGPNGQPASEVSRGRTCFRWTLGNDNCCLGGRLGYTGMSDLEAVKSQAGRYWVSFPVPALPRKILHPGNNPAVFLLKLFLLL